MIGRAWSVKRYVNTQQSSNKGTYRGKDWISGTAYEYAMMPPRYPMPVVKPNYSMSNWYHRAAYSVWLWSHTEQDTENAIRYHAHMDNRA